MNLDDAQKQKVAGWIADGLKISEIQKKLETDLGLRFTYLDTRLLMDDLKLMPKNIELPKAKEIVSEIAPAAAPAPTAAAPVAGNVSVTVDVVARPGALVSGGVTFSDGQKATWYLDEMGRLGLVPAQQGYKPTTEDVQAFQLALQNEMQKMGL